MNGIVDPYIRALSDSGRNAWKWGFSHCLTLFAIWKDGKQLVGCRGTDIKEVWATLDKEMEEICNRSTKSSPK